MAVVHHLLHAAICFRLRIWTKHWFKRREMSSADHRVSIVPACGQYVLKRQPVPILPETAT